VFEYFDELSIRDVIEKILQFPEMKNVDGYSHFLIELSKIDYEFSGVTLDKDFFEDRYWWNKKLPKIGFGEFITSLKEVYNIDDVTSI
jgi:hypothetical protein